MKISIIVPAHNEETAIEKVISDLKVYLNQDCEIIAVNDGSTDRTGEILDGISGIRTVHHQKNQGYGAAIKSGVRQSQGEYVLIIDADGTYPPENISQLISEKERYDMVVGARTNAKKQIPKLRKPAKWLLNKLANYLTKTRIPDLNSGLRIVRKDVFNRFVNLLPDGFSLTTTITLALLTNGYQIKYLPIDYYKRKGKSKIKPVRDTLNFLQLIVRTVLYFSPFRVFVPLSFIIFIAAVAVGAFSFFFTPRFADTTFVILLSTSLQTFFFGLIAELIVRTRK